MEGPALLSAGDHALFFLQTGDATDFPPSSDDAWALMPERIYVDERGADPDRWQRRNSRRRLARHDHEGRAHTLVTEVSAPIRAEDQLLHDGETPLGSLSVITAHTARRLDIGLTAATRGILLGRYARCDSADLIHDDSISRTHLLILRVEDKLYAFDTASTFGSYIQRGTRARHSFDVLGLDERAEITLADRDVVLRWHP